MNWIAVAFGGAVGAMLRYAIATYWVASPGRFPMATFVANGVGCFLMGIGFIVIVERVYLPDPARHFALVGLLGALTTFSTFAIETVSLIDAQLYKLALLYVASSLLVCLLATSAGLFSARTFF